LIDIKRLFFTTVEEFTYFNADRRADDYFAGNSGVTSFILSGDVINTFGVWGEALSLVVYQEPIDANEDAFLVSLSETPYARSEFKSLLASVCVDVRIWTFKDLRDEREPKQAGVSYLFDDGREILYSIYLQGEGDNDCLGFTPLPLERVGSCYSVKDMIDIL
jgi:hypothetical protein